MGAGTLIGLAMVLAGVGLFWSALRTVRADGKAARQRESDLEVLRHVNWSGSTAETFRCEGAGLCRGAAGDAIPRREGCA